MKETFTDFNSATDGMLPCGIRNGQPIIGLSVNIADETSRLHEAYIRSVLDSGAIPLLIPATTDAEALREITARIDGLILTGGADIGGEYFGEQTLEGLTDVLPFRDAYDFLLLKLACDRQIPVLGICRGLQVINVAFGGTLWQDIPSQYPGEVVSHNVLNHREKACHGINLEPGSLLAPILDSTYFEVNSRHHQAIKEPAPGFRVSARTTNGIIEAIEGYPTRRIFGVQWHPENMAAEDNNVKMKALFRFFTGEASLFKKAGQIHSGHLSVDSHCDTPMLFEKHNIDFGRREPEAQLDIVKMQEGKLDAAFVAAYIPQGPLDERSRLQATEKALSLLLRMKDQIGSSPEYVEQAVTFANADRLKNEGKKAIFLAIENGYSIGKEIDNLMKFKEEGVVYITLCHNGANDLCDSAQGPELHGGLSSWGIEVVREMNRLGIAIDLSHAAESTFYQVLEQSAVPVICSHSSVYTICPHPRNLTDEQIKALAGKGGVIQICLYGGFLASDREADLTDAVDHIEYIVSLVGAEYVGIGSDFDGGGGISGCNGANELINITVELLRRGHTEDIIAKILGGNLRRVIEEIQQYSQFPFSNPRTWH